MNKEYQKKYIKRNPWVTTLANIKQRIKNVDNYKSRKCSLTLKDVKYLWFRDKAFQLKRPSINRIDNDSGYFLENCEFIELSENARLGSIMETKKSPLGILKRNSKVINKTEQKKNGCQEWLGHINKDGYGRVIYFGKKMLAHRLFWELFYGKIPNGMAVVHKCENRKCCNINHLRLKPWSIKKTKLDN